MGVIIGTQFSLPAIDTPGLLAVMGFVVLSALLSVLYFGKLSPVFVVGMGVLESSLVQGFPIAGLLLGICTIAAALYGKTLGQLALDDFYENAQTRLPGLTLAAFLNFLLILCFSILVWFLFGVLPNAHQFSQWLPLAGLGV